MWTKRLKPSATLEILEPLVRILQRRGPTADYVGSLALAREYQKLLSYELNYEEIAIEDAIATRQILGFYQKLDCLPLDIDVDAVAAKRFYESEVGCLETNRTLAYHRRKPSLVPPTVSTVLHYALRKIDKILGDAPSLEELQPQFGPGANTNVNAALANPKAKLGADLVCSNNLSPYVQDFLTEVPMWMEVHSVLEDPERWVVTVLVEPGKLIFVPKNAKTSRSIIVEPLLNSFFQKGVGSYIKDRLRFVANLDLRDQTRNQSSAFKGSCDNSLATIDLSMASDTISYEVVATLLPPDWLDLLSKLRTSCVKLPASVLAEYEGGALAHYVQDGTVELQKFSSMGNGFTFELESLIFYSIASAVCTSLHLATKEVCVFGDDIIVPTAAVSRLTEVLSYLGFSVNTEKSYMDGPFRESCGSDYLHGFDIRPFYLKSQISDRILYIMHNYFVRHLDFELARATKDMILHPSEVLYGPDGYGDGHLIGDYHLHQNRQARRSGWDGGTFETYTLKPRRLIQRGKGDMALPTYSVYTRSGERNPTDPDIVRGSKGYAKVSIYTHSRTIFSKLRRDVLPRGFLDI